MHPPAPSSAALLSPRVWCATACGEDAPNDDPGGHRAVPRRRMAATPSRRDLDDRPSMTTRPEPEPDPAEVAAEVAANELGQIPVLMYHRLLPDGGGDYDNTPEQFEAELRRLHDEGYVADHHRRAGLRPDRHAGRDDAGRADLRRLDPRAVRAHRGRRGRSGHRGRDHAPTRGRARRVPRGRVVLRPRVAVRRERRARAPSSWPSSPTSASRSATTPPTTRTSGSSTPRGSSARSPAASPTSRRRSPARRSAPSPTPSGSGRRTRRWSPRASADGVEYTHLAGLLVGSGPSPSPFDAAFDPLAIPRIRSQPEPVDGATRTSAPTTGSRSWRDAPERRYVSDGDPDTIAFPAELRPTAGRRPRGPGGHLLTSGPPPTCRRTRGPVGARGCGTCRDGPGELRLLRGRGGDRDHPPRERHRLGPVAAAPPRAARRVARCATATSSSAPRSPHRSAIAPAAYQQLAHPEGEAAMARGAAAAGALMTVSTLATVSLEDVAAAAPEAPRWFQLYVFTDRGYAGELVDRAVAAGYRALVLTVDTPVLGRRWRDERHGFALRDGMRMANVPLDDARPWCRRGGGARFRARRAVRRPRPVADLRRPRLAPRAGRRVADHREGRGAG